MVLLGVKAPPSPNGLSRALSSVAILSGVAISTSRPGVSAVWSVAATSTETSRSGDGKTLPLIVETEAISTLDVTTETLLEPLYIQRPKIVT